MFHISKLLIATFFLLIAHSSQAFNANLITLSGEEIPFSSLKGKWVFINYWASWCQPCLEEIKELNRFYKREKNKIALFAVNYDNLALAEQIFLIKKLNIQYPSLRKNPAKSLGLGSIRGVPLTFVFNPEGKLSQTLFGPQTEASLCKLIGIC